MTTLKKVTLPEKPTKGFIELLGAHWGDGCLHHEVKRHNYVWSICGNLHKDESYLDYLSSIIFSLFSVKATKYYILSRNCVYITLRSMLVLNYLKNEIGVPVGKKSFSKANREYIDKSGYNQQFIRGVFDTDGCVVIRKGLRRDSVVIKIANIDFELITFIKQNLQNLNFSVNLYEDKRNSYELSVYGRKQAKRWLEVIGSNNSRNLNKLKLFV